MWVRAQTCWLPKAGNSREEYEDAFWPEHTERQARIFRVAIADGATETSFSGIWAQLLAHAYVRGRLSARRLDSSLRAPQETWWSKVGSVSLPWYAEEKIRQGAFSSLLGVTIAHGRDGVMRWHAMAVGDSCLFQVRGNALVAAFPISMAAEFGSRPYLLSTDPARNGMLAEHLRDIDGDVHSGDSFHLMTDALACWFLGEREAGGSPWMELAQNSGSPESFAAWIASLRAGGVLRNDDVTAMTVHIPMPECPDALADSARL